MKNQLTNSAGGQSSASSLFSASFSENPPDRAEKLILDYTCSEAMEKVDDSWSLSEVHSILTECFKQHETSDPLPK